MAGTSGRSCQCCGPNIGKGCYYDKFVCFDCESGAGCTGGDPAPFQGDMTLIIVLAHNTEDERYNRWCLGAEAECRTRPPNYNAFRDTYERSTYGIEPDCSIDSLNSYRGQIWITNSIEEIAFCGAEGVYPYTPPARDLNDLRFGRFETADGSGGGLRRGAGLLYLGQTYIYSSSREVALNKYYGFDVKMNQIHGNQSAYEKRWGDQVGTTSPFFDSVTCEKVDSVCKCVTPFYLTTTQSEIKIVDTRDPTNNTCSYPRGYSSLSGILYFRGIYRNFGNFATEYASWDNVSCEGDVLPQGYVVLPMTRTECIELGGEFRDGEKAFKGCDYGGEELADDNVSNFGAGSACATEVDEQTNSDIYLEGFIAETKFDTNLLAAISPSFANLFSFDRGLLDFYKNRFENCGLVGDFGLRLSNIGSYPGVTNIAAEDESFWQNLSVGQGPYYSAEASSIAQSMPLMHKGEYNHDFPFQILEFNGEYDLFQSSIEADIIEKQTTPFAAKIISGDRRDPDRNLLTEDYVLNNGYKVFTFRDKIGDVFLLGDLDNYVDMIPRNQTLSADLDYWSALVGQEIPQFSVPPYRPSQANLFFHMFFTRIAFSGSFNFTTGNSAAAINKNYGINVVYEAHEHDFVFESYNDNAQFFFGDSWSSVLVDYVSELLGAFATQHPENRILNPVETQDGQVYRYTIKFIYYSEVFKNDENAPRGPDFKSNYLARRRYTPVSVDNYSYEEYKTFNNTVNPLANFGFRPYVREKFTSSMLDDYLNLMLPDNIYTHIQGSAGSQYIRDGQLVQGSGYEFETIEHIGASARSYTRKCCLAALPELSNTLIPTTSGASDKKKLSTAVSITILTTNPTGVKQHLMDLLLPKATFEPVGFLAECKEDGYLYADSPYYYYSYAYTYTGSGRGSVWRSEGGFGNYDGITYGSIQRTYNDDCLGLCSISFGPPSTYDGRSDRNVSGFWLDHRYSAPVSTASSDLNFTYSSRALPPINNVNITDAMRQLAQNEILAQEDPDNYPDGAIKLSQCIQLLSKDTITKVYHRVCNFESPPGAEFLRRAVSLSGGNMFYMDENGCVQGTTDSFFNVGDDPERDAAMFAQDEALFLSSNPSQEQIDTYNSLIGLVGSYTAQRGIDEFIQCKFYYGNPFILIDGEPYYGDSYIAQLTFDNCANQYMHARIIEGQPDQSSNIYTGSSLFGRASNVQKFNHPVSEYSCQNSIRGPGGDCYGGRRNYDGNQKFYDILNFPVLSQYEPQNRQNRGRFSYISPSVSNYFYQYKYRRGECGPGDQESCSYLNEAYREIASSRYASLPPICFTDICCSAIGLIKQYFESNSNYCVNSDNLGATIFEEDGEFRYDHTFGGEPSTRPWGPVSHNYRSFRQSRLYGKKYEHLSCATFSLDFLDTSSSPSQPHVTYLFHRHKDPTHKIVMTRDCYTDGDSNGKKCYAFPGANIPGDCTDNQHGRTAYAVKSLEGDLCELDCTGEYNTTIADLCYEDVENQTKSKTNISFYTSAVQFHIREQGSDGFNTIMNEIYRFPYNGSYPVYSNGKLMVSRYNAHDDWEKADYTKFFGSPTCSYGLVASNGPNQRPLQDGYFSSLPMLPPEEIVITIDGDFCHEDYLGCEHHYYKFGTPPPPPCPEQVVNPLPALPTDVPPNSRLYRLNQAGGGLGRNLEWRVGIPNAGDEAEGQIWECREEGLTSSKDDVLKTYEGYASIINTSERDDLEGAVPDGRFITVPVAVKHFFEDTGDEIETGLYVDQPCHMLHTVTFEMIDEEICGGGFSFTPNGDATGDFVGVPGKYVSSLHPRYTDGNGFFDTPQPIGVYRLINSYEYLPAGSLFFATQDPEDFGVEYELIKNLNSPVEFTLETDGAGNMSVEVYVIQSFSNHKHTYMGTTPSVMGTMTNNEDSGQFSDFERNRISTEPPSELNGPDRVTVGGPSFENGFTSSYFRNNAVADFYYGISGGEPPPQSSTPTQDTYKTWAEWLEGGSVGDYTDIIEPYSRYSGARYKKDFSCDEVAAIFQNAEDLDPINRLLSSTLAGEAKSIITLPLAGLDALLNPVPFPWVPLISGRGNNISIVGG